MHPDMHTYTFTHTHGTLSILFMHRITSLACSKNTTWECHQHPKKCVFNIYYTSGVCINLQKSFFQALHVTHPSANTHTEMQTSCAHTYCVSLTFPAEKVTMGRKIMPSLASGSFAQTAANTAMTAPDFGSNERERKLVVCFFFNLVLS